MKNTTSVTQRLYKGFYVYKQIVISVSTRHRASLYIVCFAESVYICYNCTLVCIKQYNVEIIKYIQGVPDKVSTSGKWENTRYTKQIKWRTFLNFSVCK